MWRAAREQLAHAAGAQLGDPADDAGAGPVARAPAVGERAGLGPDDALRRRIDELEQALADRDRFIATLGHELRNPLSPVVLQVAHLVSSVDDTRRPVIAREWLLPRLRQLDVRLGRLRRTLDRVLDMTRIQRGMLELELEDVDLAAVVAEVASGFERELSAGHCELHLSLGAPLVGRWDRTALDQIVSNLVSNAIRYGAGAAIDVVLEATDEQAMLSVTDRGMGISPEDQRTIFECFARAGASARAGGIGVGLWLVQSLTAALGGSVAVRSVVGQGSTFTVRLPRNGRERT